jgi:uncharacterized protein YbgA (DUF1722 family)
VAEGSGVQASGGARASGDSGQAIRASDDQAIRRRFGEILQILVKFAKSSNIGEILMKFAGYFGEILLKILTIPFYFVPN